MKEYFENIKDPRQQSKVQHNFVETIMMVICAVIAGCDDWEDIADYCRVKYNWFKERLGMKLENGIPSHDTMSRIFGMIEPKEFQSRFIAWVEGSVSQKAREILSIDGKTMCGSRDKKKKPIHMVSAWGNKAKAVFGQVSVDEKSNEITAVPELLELLDGSAKNRHRLFTVTIARCHVSTERLRCKKKRAVKNRIENPILHSSGSFVYFSFRPSGRFFRFSF